MSRIARWPAAVDEILGGDQAVALAHTTPAGGVILTPLTNLGVRDRHRGTATPVTSSVGMWRKLAAIRDRPQVAVAFHSRAHGYSRRPEYVLVQGTASLPPLGRRDWLDAHRDSWERFSGPRDVGPVWERWLAAYHWRVGVEIAVERVIVWPDLRCHGTPAIHGSPFPSEPAEGQRPPARGTEPRVNHRRATRRAARLPHLLLGWVGPDGLPVVAPAEVAGAEERGIVLSVPERLVPPGGRRAGLLAHSFARYTMGQNQRRHTGWLEAGADPGRVLYAPHTEAGYHLPESRLLFRLASGYVTRRGLREARSAGFLPEGKT